MLKDNVLQKLSKYFNFLIKSFTECSTSHNSNSLCTFHAHVFQKILFCLYSILPENFFPGFPQKNLWCFCSGLQGHFEENPKM